MRWSSLLRGENPKCAPFSPDRRRAFHDWLDRLEAIARGQTKGEYPMFHRAGRLDAGDLARAIGVAETLLGAGGHGLGMALEALLTVIAMSEDPALVGFWERIAPSRHRFGRKDTTARTRARLACLWLRAATRRGDPSAASTLLRLLDTFEPATCGDELFTSVRVLSRHHSSETSRFVELAERVAVHHVAFEARYLARRTLAFAGRPVPFEAPRGLFRFALALERFKCAIEVPSDGLLSALHVGIQRALRWDDDHLWCFYLNGNSSDGRFEWMVDGAHEGPRPLDVEEDVMPLTDEWRHAFDDLGQDYVPRIGELGLRPSDKLLYHFDFGANHQIPVRLSAIEESLPKGTRATLPRVVEAKGARPKQYRF
ncbi:MAG: hypothetical protein HYV09_41175 [Deltaproteobacteria bacterium]|nr:hypothetical protein [Deltaproteobacteria bacterium]